MPTARNLRTMTGKSSGNSAAASRWKNHGPNKTERDDLETWGRRASAAPPNRSADPSRPVPAPPSTSDWRSATKATPPRLERNSSAKSAYPCPTLAVACAKEIDRRAVHTAFRVLSPASFSYNPARPSSECRMDLNSGRRQAEAQLRRVAAPAEPVLSCPDRPERSTPSRPTTLPRFPW